MTLYLYKTGTSVSELTIENVVSYTSEKAVTEDGSVYNLFGSELELSSKPDCSETLRADWKRDHPSQEQRMEELESILAKLLFGGESL